MRFCAPSCISAIITPWIGLCSVSTTLFLSVRAGTTTVTDVYAVHYSPIVIIASILHLPIASERAFF